MSILLCLLLTLPGEEKPPHLGETEQKLFEAANAARGKEKIDKLQIDRTLMKLALDHARNMAKQEKMEHVLDGKGVADRAKEAGYRYRAIGENIAQAIGEEDTPAPAPALIHQSWMESEGHRANLLNPKFQQMGIAVVKSDKGTFFYCQVFGTPLK
jgi:uncharacterized protein YkwD